MYIDSTFRSSILVVIYHSYTFKTSVHLGSTWYVSPTLLLLPNDKNSSERMLLCGLTRNTNTLQIFC